MFYQDGSLPVSDIDTSFHGLSFNNHDEDLPNSIYPPPSDGYTPGTFGFSTVQNALMQPNMHRSTDSLNAAYGLHAFPVQNMVSASNEFGRPLTTTAYNYVDQSAAVQSTADQAFDVFTHDASQYYYGSSLPQSVVPQPFLTHDDVAGGYVPMQANASTHSAASTSYATSDFSSPWEATSQLSVASPQGSSYCQTYRSTRSKGVTKKRKQSPVKRASKPAQSNTTFDEFTLDNDLHVRCQGRPFSLEFAEDKTISTVKPRGPSRDNKPHKCPFVSNDGQACGRSFERSEHLKRHSGMHSQERPYPCPLPGCNKRIGRPDNATDHFKTHLKKDTKGKRNKNCSWYVLEQHIIAKYPQRQSDKLRHNLNKWLATRPDLAC
jgi:uncharacterized Zn-finger protein